MWGFPSGSAVKNLTAMQEMKVRPLVQEDLEEGMATHSSILAWRIPWTEEPSRLWYTGLQRVRRDWSNWAYSHIGKVPRWHAGILAQVQWEFEVCLWTEKKFWKILTSESLLLRTTLHSSSLRLSAMFTVILGKRLYFLLQWNFIRVILKVFWLQPQ